VLGVSVALLRDTIQIVRAFGDVLRFVLVTSLALEIFSGLLIDSPIRFLSITGSLDSLGPIQGIVGSRNQLGIIAVIGIITFATELRTRSVRRGTSTGSITLAVLCLLLSQSPVAFGSAVIVGLASTALFGLRKAQGDQRHFWQAGLLAASVIAAILAWVFRRQIIDVLDATKDLNYRLDLWRRIMDLTSTHPIEGWGWIGAWRSELAPFLSFQDVPGGVPQSATNAFFDVWFQLGLAGLLGFLIMVTLAFVRSWLLAVSRHSVVFAWPPLVLLTLITASLAESSILVEFGWLTLVVCIVKASRELSWRQAFTTASLPPDLPHEKPVTG
jgi:O-antigen ligase